MYTTRTVAQKTKTSQAEVRYFARKLRLAKIILAGKATFLFDKKEYRLFCRYLKGIKRQKEHSKQLTFSFFDECTVLVKRPALNVQQKKKEALLVERLCTLLKTAGASGMDKAVIQTTLNITKQTLHRLLNKHSTLPIAEDDRIDNNLYWVGREKSTKE